jgi:hypothetical protein
VTANSTSSFFFSFSAFFILVDGFTDRSDDEAFATPLKWSSASKAPRSVAFIRSASIAAARTSAPFERGARKAFCDWMSSAWPAMPVATRNGSSSDIA